MTEEEHEISAIRGLLSLIPDARKINHGVYTKLIEACVDNEDGKGDYRITEENFPPSNLVVRPDPQLVKIKTGAYDHLEAKEILARIEQAGRKPATLWELLHYGAHNSEKIKKLWETRETSWIWALGSIALIDGEPHAVHLSRHGDLPDHPRMVVCNSVHPTPRWGTIWCAKSQFLTVG